MGVGGRGKGKHDQVWTYSSFFGDGETNKHSSKAYVVWCFGGGKGGVRTGGGRGGMGVEGVRGQHDQVWNYFLFGDGETKTHSSRAYVLWCFGGGEGWRADGRGEVGRSLNNSQAFSMALKSWEHLG